MTKKRSIFSIRRRGPQIRLTKNGVRVTRPTISVGTKAVRVNLGSRSGPSLTTGAPGLSYNTRRGCIISPFTLLGNLFKRR